MCHLSDDRIDTDDLPLMENGASLFGQFTLLILLTMKTRLISLTYLLIALLLAATIFHSEVNAADADSSAEAKPDRSGRSTAVALNYCRASFHRIRKNPTLPVIHEEREKILNNLSLNGIADAEVIQLYSEVLDEVGQIPLVDRELDMYKSKFNRNLRKDLAFDALAISLQVASAQYMSALRTGANSWWDYRNLSWGKEFELLKIDKQRAQNVVKKSSLFLDTFWKLAQKKNIPDRWLIRGDDLDRLDEAMDVNDLEARLRVLKRMKNFMEVYPPYWYYVGRTQQALGKWEDAAETYALLADVGGGFFRHDDMLATAMANRAAILVLLKKEGAVEAAEDALAYSSDVWQANLMAARVLEKHGKVEVAEDAILRNLDVDLESDQSLVFLMSLYYHSKNVAKIQKRLNDTETVAKLPIALTLTCASLLPEEKVPDSVTNYIQTSLIGSLAYSFQNDDFVFQATPNWNFQQATVKLECGSHRANTGNWKQSDKSLELRFREIGDFGTPLKNSVTYLPVRLYLQYPNSPAIRLTFDYKAEEPQALSVAKEETAPAGVPHISGSGFRVTSVVCGGWNWPAKSTEQSQELPEVTTPILVPPPVEATRPTYSQGR